MTFDDSRDWNAHQRAVMVAEWLDGGERLTLTEIARRLGITLNGAKYIVLAVSVIKPYHEIEGEWQRVKSDFTTA